MSPHNRVGTNSILDSLWSFVPKRFAGIVSSRRVRNTKTTAGARWRAAIPNQEHG